MDIKVFESLNCPNCQSCFSEFTSDSRRPCITQCYKPITLCAKCFAEEQKLPITGRKHQCGSNINCFSTMVTSYCSCELIAILDKAPNHRGYVLSKETEIPECPTCHEEYSLDKALEPYALKCGHMVCNGCFLKIHTVGSHPSSQWKYSVKCPNCQVTGYYNEKSWDNPLKGFLREIPLMKKQLEVDNLRKKHCGECKKEELIDDLFDCQDCPVLLCGKCGLKNHRQHIIVEAKTREVKGLVAKSKEILAPKLSAFDVCLPKIHGDVIQKISDLKKQLEQKLVDAESMGFLEAYYQTKFCEGMGDEFEGITETFFENLRFYDKQMQELIRKANQNATTNS